MLPELNSGLTHKFIATDPDSAPSICDNEGAGAEVEGMDSVAGMQLYIHPDECIDCGACEPECPVDAIYDEDELPEEYEKFIEINANFFEE